MAQNILLFPQFLALSNFFFLNYVSFESLLPFKNVTTSLELDSGEKDRFCFYMVQYDLKTMVKSFPAINEALLIQDGF